MKTKSIVKKIEYKNVHKKFCHMCKSGKLFLVLDLGHQPHSDDFVEKHRLDAEQHVYPLRLVQCENCGLLQIDYFVDPRILYQTNYVYDTSATKAGVEHYNKMADEVMKKFNFPKDRKAHV